MPKPKSANVPELSRLQVQIRQATMKALKAQAASEILTIGILVRQILDEHVARAPTEALTG